MMYFGVWIGDLGGYIGGPGKWASVWAPMGLPDGWKVDDVVAHV